MLSTEAEAKSNFQDLCIIPPNVNLNNEKEVRDAFFTIQKTSVLSLKIYDTNFAMKGSVKNMVFHKFNVWNIINKVKNAVSF